MARQHTCEGCGAKLVSFWASFCEECNDLMVIAKEIFQHDKDEYDA